jgi:hypothetical protein
MQAARELSVGVGVEVGIGIGISTSMLPTNMVQDPRAKFTAGVLLAHPFSYCPTRQGRVAPGAYTSLLGVFHLEHEYLTSASRSVSFGKLKIDSSTVHL